MRSLPATSKIFLLPSSLGGYREHDPGAIIEGFGLTLNQKITTTLGSVLEYIFAAFVPSRWRKRRLSWLAF